MRKMILTSVLAMFGAGIFLTAGAPGEAAGRIQTGRDLYDACAFAVSLQDRPVAQRPRGRGLYCRQFVSGYLGSLEHLYKDESTRKIHGNEEAHRIQCNYVPDVASFDQLERRVVVYGERHKELWDRPAIELMEVTFDKMNPC